MFSDPHVGQGQFWEVEGGLHQTHDAHWAFAVDKACDMGAEWVVVLGDLTVDSDQASGDNSFKPLFDGWIAGRARLLPIPGNHDVFDYNLARGAGARSATNPYHQLTDQFNELFGGKPYYSSDLGSIRLVVLCTNADTTILSGGTAYDQVYAPDNYPYYNLTYWRANGYDEGIPKGNPNGSNGDMFGITSRTSAQYQWAIDKLNDGGFTWKVVASHRGAFSALDVNIYTSRPPLKSMRYKFMAAACSLGVDLALSGDAHVASYTKRIKTTNDGHYSVNPADSVGIHYYQTAGTFVRRATNTAFLPAGSAVYASPMADTLSLGYFVHWAMLEFNGDRACLTHYRTAEGPASAYEVRNVKVFSRVIMAEGARQ